MRLGTITAKVKGGPWVTLAQPDVSIAKQKKYFKMLKAGGGKGVKLPDGKVVDLENAIYLDTSGGKGKRITFKERAAKPVTQKVKEGFVKNLAELAVAVGLDDAGLKKAKAELGDAFPKKGDFGYDVEALKALLSPMMAAGLDALAAALEVSMEDLQKEVELDEFPAPEGVTEDDDAQPIFDVEKVREFMSKPTGE